MQFIFDHTFGKQEQQDLVVCRPLAIFDNDEEAESIDHGWLALDEPVGGREVFYQSRSTRINLDRFRPRFREHTWRGRRIEIKVIDASEMVKLLGLPERPSEKETRVLAEGWRPHRGAAAIFTWHCYNNAAL